MVSTGSPFATSMVKTLTAMLEQRGAFFMRFAPNSSWLLASFIWPRCARGPRLTWTAPGSRQEEVARIGRGPRLSYTCERHVSDTP